MLLINISIIIMAGLIYNTTIISTGPLMLRGIKIGEVRTTTAIVVVDVEEIEALFIQEESYIAAANLRKKIAVLNQKQGDRFLSINSLLIQVESGTPPSTHKEGHQDSINKIPKRKDLYLLGHKCSLIGKLLNKIMNSRKLKWSKGYLSNTLSKDHMIRILMNLRTKHAAFASMILTQTISLSK